MHDEEKNETLGSELSHSPGRVTLFRNNLGGRDEIFQSGSEHGTESDAIISAFAAARRCCLCNAIHILSTQSAN